MGPPLSPHFRQGEKGAERGIDLPTNLVQVMLVTVLEWDYPVVSSALSGFERTSHAPRVPHSHTAS